MKPSLLILVAIAPALLTLSPALARGSPHEAQYHPSAGQPCGWTAGALPDPAETQRCLAARFKPPKRADPAAPAAPASANSTAVPNG